MNRSVLSAIFRRNFSSYFANPTGYVFICVFVLLSSFAAFWPNEFFTNNLANLDQLNLYFPWIMLIFVPAITMSIWAEERRQGTDELLLTIPAADIDVVLGKYLAAVAIYLVSLAFSAACNFAVLRVLGNPDGGLFLTTYFGYSLVGAAMLSIGMVASFLTNNITVGFVLGALFNVPLVFADQADALSGLPIGMVRSIQAFSVSEHLADFSAGVISLTSLIYFGAIIVVMLYLTMVLIGKRHWAGGRDGISLGPHYALRALALGAAAVGLLWLLSYVPYPLRGDFSNDRLNTLSPDSIKLLGNLDPKRPIDIDAFISPTVPEDYVPVREHLITRLHEMAAHGGKNIRLRIHSTEPFSDASERAEKLFGITGQVKGLENRGQLSSETIYLGVALRAGLDKQIIPFVEPWTPVEYELIRSIATLNGGDRKRLGVFVVDKNAWQDFNPDTRQMAEPEIIAELRKQYEIVDVDPNKAVPDNLDVLMAVQPSVCQPNQIDHLIDAVRRGVPTMIFEDAHLYNMPGLQQLADRGGMHPFMQEAGVRKLWDLLGISVTTEQIVTHGHQPLKRFEDVPPEIVFIGNEALSGSSATKSLFDEQDPISKGTQELVFMFAGWITKKENSKLDFTALVRTSKASGYVTEQQLLAGSLGGEGARSRPNPTGVEYVLAAHIQGAPPPDPTAGVKPAGDEPADGAAPAAGDAPKNEVTAAPTGTATPAGTAAATALPPVAVPTASPSGTAAAKPAKPPKMDVVVVADLDWIAGLFFRLRSQRPADGRMDRSMVFDNIAFVLNGLDVLSGDDRFLDVRKRRPTFRTLERLDRIYEESQDRMIKAETDYEKGLDEELEAVKKRYVDEREKLIANKDLKLIDKENRLRLFKRDEQRKIAAKEQELNRLREKKRKESLREMNDQIRDSQQRYKMWAVVLPPIPPLLIGLIVFFNRRAREQEGVDKSRLT